MPRKLQYLPYLNLQALLKSYMVHLNRLSAPEDNKRHEKLAKNMIRWEPDLILESDLLALRQNVCKGILSVITLK